MYKIGVEQFPSKKFYIGFFWGFATGKYWCLKFLLFYLNDAIWPSLFLYSIQKIDLKSDCYSFF